MEENLALIQTIVGGIRCDPTLSQNCYKRPIIAVITATTGVTPALLRLDPFWDPLRSDPAFQKLCEEKQLRNNFTTDCTDNTETDIIHEVLTTNGHQ